MDDIKEISVQDLNSFEKANRFIERQAGDIRRTVGDGIAVNALSGGVDSSVVTLLGFKALGKRLITFFIDNGLMRARDGIFQDLTHKGVEIQTVDAWKEFFGALKGIRDPEKSHASPPPDNSESAPRRRKCSTSDEDAPPRA